MAAQPTKQRARRKHRTIILPITEEQYAEIIADAQRVRSEWLDPLYAQHPELFPFGFEKGYEMKGHYKSKRQNLIIRRIALRDGTKYQLRPVFALPMMVARTKDVELGLFYRKFGVPYWALARGFGRNATFGMCIILKRRR
jgi:hypothetical protein